MAIATESGHALTLHDVSNYTRYTIGSECGIGAGKLFQLLGLEMYE